MLLLGIIGSGRYGEKQVASLPLNESREVLGHSLTYEGSRITDDGKSVFTVRAQSGSRTFLLEPVMFRSDFDNNIMRTPDYVSSLAGDFYVEPVCLESASGTTTGGDSSVVAVRKGESFSHSGITVTFLRFDMAPKDAEGLYYAEGVVSGEQIYMVIYSGNKIYYTATLAKSDNGMYMGKAVYRVLADKPEAKEAQSFLISLKKVTR